MDIKRTIEIACCLIQKPNQIWKSKNISKGAKIKVYETLVLSAQLYNFERWVVKEAQKNRIRVFKMACLRKIEGVTRRDKIRNEGIRERVGGVSLLFCKFLDSNQVFLGFLHFLSYFSLWPLQSFVDMSFQILLACFSALLSLSSVHVFRVIE